MERKNPERSYVQADAGVIEQAIYTFIRQLERDNSEEILNKTEFSCQEFLYIENHPYTTYIKVRILTINRCA